MSALHWEAVRKQKMIDKKHEWDQKGKEELQKLIGQHREEMSEKKVDPTSASYEKQLKTLLSENGACARGHYHQTLDEERRREIQEAAIKEFSAKMARRYNDIDFAQQW